MRFHSLKLLRSITRGDGAAATDRDILEWVRHDFSVSRTYFPYEPYSSDAQTDPPPFLLQSINRNPKSRLTPGCIASGRRPRWRPSETPRWATPSSSSTSSPPSPRASLTRKSSLPVSGIVVPLFLCSFAFFFYSISFVSLSCTNKIFFHHKKHKNNTDPGTTPEEKASNAKYVISIARKIGVSFL